MDQSLMGTESNGLNLWLPWRTKDYYFTDNEILEVKVISMSSSGWLVGVALGFWFAIAVVVMVELGSNGGAVGGLIAAIIYFPIINGILRPRRRKLAAKSPEELIEAGSVSARIPWADVRRVEPKHKGEILRIDSTLKKFMVVIPKANVDAVMSFLATRLGERLISKS